jgi:hypothetical protein
MGPPFVVRGQGDSLWYRAFPQRLKWLRSPAFRRLDTRGVQRHLMNTDRPPGRDLCPRSAKRLETSEEAAELPGRPQSRRRPRATKA